MIDSARARVIAISAALLGIAVWYFWPPAPRLSSDAFELVMATYSASQSKDSERIQSIESLVDRMSLVPGEQEILWGLIQTAKAGEWQEAANESFEIMQAQKRAP